MLFNPAQSSKSPAAAPHGLLPLACGIGLKPQHYQQVMDDISEGPQWLEVHPQNYFGLADRFGGGPPHRWLTAFAEKFPLSFHSTGLSVGSASGCNVADLERLVALCDRYQPAQVSDHLSWSGDAHDRAADLFPVPYTQEALDHVCGEVNRVQDHLARTMLIENPSRYLAYADDEMDEVTFLDRLCRRTGCGLLLDINNVEVSCTNLGLSADRYIDAIAPGHVGEIHLAGHAVEMHDSGPLLIDDHGSAVSDVTWALYQRFIARAGARPVLIEWDTNVPDYPVLMAEMAKADRVLRG